MKKMAVTGSSKLAGAIINRFNADSFRIHDNIPFSEYDVFVNNAHVGFCQTTILKDWFDINGHDNTKLIINISSRAGLPNLSKGYIYAAQKASLDHLSDNLVYNSNKQARITTLCLGMIEEEEYSLKYNEICQLMDYIVNLPYNLEIPKMYFQHSYNYKEIQREKAIKLNSA